MKANVFITAVCAMFTMTLSAQTLHEMASAAPSNATRIFGADSSRAVPGFFPGPADVRIFIMAEADNRQNDFSYVDAVFTSPEKAKEHLEHFVRKKDNDETLTSTTTDGKEIVVIKDRNEVKTIIMFAPDRTCQTELERGAIQHGKGNLYTPYANLLKNAFFFVIVEEMKAGKTATIIVYLEPAGKEALATVSLEYTSKAAGEQYFSNALKPEKGEARENAVRAKIKRVNIPGLDGPNRITLQVRLANEAELETLLDDIVDDMEEDDDDDDD